MHLYVVFCYTKNILSVSNMDEGTICFRFIFLFNGISIFIAYLMTKSFSKKNSSGTI